MKTGIVMYEQADKDQKEHTRNRLEAYEKSLKEKAKEKKRSQKRRSKGMGNKAVYNDYRRYGAYSMTMAVQNIASIIYEYEENYYGLIWIW